MATAINGYPITPQKPLGFGPTVRCGNADFVWGGVHYSQDEYSGVVVQALANTAVIHHSFYLSAPATNIMLKVCLTAVGNPTGPVAVSILNTDTNAVFTGSIPSSYIVKQSTGDLMDWTLPISVAGTFPAGNYTASLSYAAGTTTDYYWPYLNFGTVWGSQNSHCSYTPPSPNDGFMWNGDSYTIYGNSGTSVIWVLDSTGTQTLALCPFGATGDQGLVPIFQFSTPNACTFNGIAIYLSDWPCLFGPYSILVKVVDMITGTTIGSGLLTQGGNRSSTTNPMKGAFGEVIIQFTQGVYTSYAGQNFLVNVDDNTGNFAGLVRTSLVNPSIAATIIAPTGAYWWGELINADFSSGPSILDYANVDLSGPGGIGGVMVAGVRAVFNTTSPLQNVKVKMKSTTGPTSVLNTSYAKNGAGTIFYCNVYYAQDSGNSSQPTGSILSQGQISSGNTMSDGWLTISGFTNNFSPNAKTPYALVWTNPLATSAYNIARLVTPHRCDSQEETGNYQFWSYDGGNSWSNSDPSQGPAEIVWSATTLAETIGNPFDDIETVSEMVMIPFTAKETGQISTVHVAGQNALSQLMICQDDGSGNYPNVSNPIGSGTMPTPLPYPSNYTGVIVPLSVMAQTTLGQKVYLVFPNGNRVNYYWTTPTDPYIQFPAMSSSNNGVTWANPTQFGEFATVLFEIGYLPSGGTVQTPTTTTVTVSSA